MYRSERSRVWDAPRIYMVILPVLDLAPEPILSGMHAAVYMRGPAREFHGSCAITSVHGLGTNLETSILDLTCWLIGAVLLKRQYTAHARVFEAGPCCRAHDDSVQL